MEENKKKRKGFTLIELLGVIVVLAIILVITVPLILNNVKNSKKKSLDNVGTIVNNAIDDQRSIETLGDSVQTNSAYKDYCANYNNCAMKGQLYKFNSNKNNNNEGKKLLESLGYNKEDIDLNGSYFYINENNKVCTHLVPAVGGHFDTNDEYSYDSCRKESDGDITEVVIKNKNNQENTENNQEDNTDNNSNPNNNGITNNEEEVNIKIDACKYENKDSIVISGQGIYTDENGNHIIKDIVEITSFSFDESTCKINGETKNIDLRKADKLKRIEASAFAGKGLAGELKLPISIEEIGDGAFFNNSFTKVNFEELVNLKTIGASAFVNNNLDSITIPENVNSIGFMAFWAIDGEKPSNPSLKCIMYKGNNSIADWYNPSYTNLNDC